MCEGRSVALTIDLQTLNDCPLRWLPNARRNKRA